MLAAYPILSIGTTQFGQVIRLRDTVNAAVCFDSSGQLTEYLNSTTNNDELEPGQTRPFEVGTALAAEDCPSYLVAGYGSAQ